ncbi:MAG: MmgE/PrpD family protein, partial [Boseongicola sp.]|nr:MmgE/PrpD family protein [Boseongicola sp.]
MKDKVQLQSAAEFALNWPVSDVPEKTLVYVAHLLLDTIGVAAAAHDTDAGRIARDTAFLLYNTQSETHRASILFDGRTASLPGAAFAAASQIDNLDAHDGYNPVKGHIAVAVVPSLLSLAAQLPNLSGREALAALAISYEIAGRAGLALHDTVSDYHTSGAWNSLGVAALAARLRGASEDTLRQALGIAEYHGPRSQMMREINNPTMLHDGSGMGAFIGLSALLMAEQGFTGAPAITVEDDQVAHYWEDLGSHWLTDEQYVKPYPICRWAHAAIDGAEKIRQVHGISGSDVASIRIGAFQNATELFAGMPTTTSQAQYSLPFAVAAMLERGEVAVK